MTTEPFVPTDTAPTAGEGTTAASILIVDDDLRMRDLLAMTLALAGHRVTSADDGETAQVAMTAHAGVFQLVITDVEMPRLRGDELAEWVVREHPATRVILMSGSRPADGARAWPFIEKPFHGEALVRLVGEVLDGRGAEGESADGAAAGDGKISEQRQHRLGGGWGDELGVRG